MTHAPARIFYLAAYSILGYAVLLTYLPRFSLAKGWEWAILAYLLSAAFYFIIPVPRYRTNVTLTLPFEILALLILKEQAIFLQFFLVALWQLGTLRLNNVVSKLLFIFNPIRKVPIMAFGLFLYFNTGGKDFSRFSEVPWLSIGFLSLTVGLLDWLTNNIYVSLSESRPPWKISVPLIQLFDLPFSPLAVPLYLLYQSGGAFPLFLLSLPSVALIWLARQFFLESFKKQESVELLNVATELIHSSLNLDRMIQAICERVRDLTGSDGVELFLMEEEELKVQHILGESPWENNGPPSEFLRDLFKFLRSEPTAISSTRNQPLFSAYARKSLFSLLIFPLFLKNRLSGCIVCTRNMASYYYQDHFDMARILAGQINSALSGAILYEKLQKTLQELKSTQSQLLQSEKMAGLGKLAAGVAHEMNNPLAAVVLNLEQLLGDPNDGRATELALSAARRCQAIVEKLLYFSRPAGEGAVVFEISQAVSDSLQFLKRQLELENIEIRVECSGNPKASGHPQDLMQALVDLLSNARDAIRAKGGKGLILIKIQEKADGSILEVSDNGNGIPPHLLSRIFEPFFTTKEVGEGTGLGLSVTHGIVSAMGGSIEAKSKEGEGTAFFLAFPPPSSSAIRSKLVDRALKSV